MGTARLSARAVGHRFGAAGDDGLEVVRDIDISVAAGQFVALVGPSGCGKSTLLRILGGLIRPSQGQVDDSEGPVDGPSPKRAMVFQQPALLPWLTVAQNIAFGLPAARRRAGQGDARVAALLAEIGLTDFADRRPAALSGGMAQRVALARALAGAPELLLLDEPFASLDQQTREDMQDLLAGFIDAETRAAVLVTHDIDEALYLADQVLLLSPRPGRVIDQFTVPAPRPRPAAARTSAALVALKRDIAGALRRSMAAGADQPGGGSVGR